MDRVQQILDSLFYEVKSMLPEDDSRFSVYGQMINEVLAYVDADGFVKKAPAGEDK